MTSITAINVFIEVDGKQCIAIINPAMAEVFVQMLPAFQRGESKAPTLSRLPDDVADKLIETRRAIYQYLHNPKETS